MAEFEYTVVDRNEYITAEIKKLEEDRLNIEIHQALVDGDEHLPDDAREAQTESHTQQLEHLDRRIAVLRDLV